ncbi:hypothetical protein [Pedobacter miscanthi]|uniref:DUF2116 family Zn-ribbon domain-containing protein n=1 Tax=Pedobacter miscanthi TaxID=2259170 RepID=A0A366KYJ2_9SPHI|nr:hypothetical protein [Pedobacter miscanthi]RBQ06715.1 hypothetical protein DRW42_13100 [Pedobacter miscanthi]
MSQQATPQEKTRCRYCEKELHGRAGKIFCNVDCKNNYNSRIRSFKRATENELFPKVINAIKKNYRILIEFHLQDEKDGILMVKKTDLENLGFNPQYFTAAALDSNETLWKSCFHQCWADYEEYFGLRYVLE